MSANLKELVGAPTSPVDTSNKVDLVLFAKQVNFLVENGVSLLAYPMHIGESLNITDGERMDLARTLVETVDGRVPNFVHVPHGGPDNSAKMAEHSAKIGSAGIVLMAPYHWQPQTD